MKTPREILLGRHRKMEPKLDELRDGFIRRLTTLGVDAATRQHPLGSKQSPAFDWLGFLRMARWHLAGLTTAWAVIALLSLSGAGSNTATIAQRKLVSPRTIILTLKENRRLISEFGNLPDASLKNVLPAVPQSRRGQICTDWAYS